MKIYNELSDENKDFVLALGFFDGVHLAHQKLIKKTVELAKTDGLKSAILTFKTSPFSIIKNLSPVYISSFDKKSKLIETLGVDELYVLDFYKFKEIKAPDYIENVLLKYFSPKFVVTGFNHTFGLNKEGNSELLSKNQNFKYVEIEPFKIEDEIVSSTNIKNLIQQGNIKKANRMLGYNFSIKGAVVKGAQIARKLGYKTANLIWNKEIVKPKYGVYFGFVIFNNKKYDALINFGIRPSVDKELKETLEVHLLNFEGDLYNKTIEVEFVSKLRDEIKFNSIEELKTQIDKDYNIVTVQSKINAEQINR